MEQNKIKYIVFSTLTLVFFAVWPTKVIATVSCALNGSTTVTLSSPTQTLAVTATAGGPSNNGVSMNVIKDVPGSWTKVCDTWNTANASCSCTIGSACEFGTYSFSTDGPGKYYVMCNGYNTVPDPDDNCTGSPYNLPPNTYLPGWYDCGSTDYKTVYVCPGTGVADVTGNFTFDGPITGTVNVCANNGTCHNGVAIGGTYSLTLPIGQLYTITATPTDNHYLPSNQSIISPGLHCLGATRNFAFNYNCGGSGCGSFETIDAGAVYDNLGSINPGSGTVSQRNWRAKDQATKHLLEGPYPYNFTYWDTLPANKIDITGNPNIFSTINSIDGLLASNPGETIYYTFTGDLTVGAVQTVSGDGNAVFIVNGDLNINQRIVRLNKNGFVGFIVEGDIIVQDGLYNSYHPTEPVIEGFFYTENSFKTGGGSTKFIGRGIFIANKGFVMGRDLGTDINLGNPANPAEQFIYDPSLVLNAPAQFHRSTYSWKEIAL